MQQIQTGLTDRQLLVHVLEHVEELDAKISAMHEAFQRYMPLLDRLAPGGRLDYLAAAQLARAGRTSGRRGGRRTERG